VKARNGLSRVLTNLSLKFIQGEHDLTKWIKKILPKKFRDEEIEIPVVRLQGVIEAGGNSPFKNSLSLSSCADNLAKAFAHKQAPAIAIIVNSPGGSPVQSRLIFKRIRDLAEEKNKHVITFIEDAAASGGYMIACAGDEIIADPSSIVGSIGVVSSSFGFPELLKKIGVERRVYTAGKNKVSLDPFQPEKASDIEHLKSLQLEIHDVFINLVKERRGVKLKNDETIFTGMFWAGMRGKELGLVDALGDMRSVLVERYGVETKFKLITSGRGLLGGRKAGLGLSQSQDFGVQIAHAAAEGLLHTVETKTLWSRYGL